MSGRSWAYLLACASIWGFSFLFAAIALRDLSPEVVTLGRTGLAAAVLIPAALWRGALAGLRGHVGALLVVGVVQLFAPFLLIAYGQLSVPSGLAGVLVASTPIWTAALAVRLDAAERSHGLRLLGVGVGIIGVGVLLGVELSGAVRTLVGGTLLLLAGLGYALGGFVIKSRLHACEPLGVIAVAMLAATVLLVPLAAGALPPVAPSPGVVLGVAALGVLSGGVGWLLYYSLIADVGPARASIVYYVVPAFAVLYGIALLDEPATAGTFVGLVLVAIGSWCASGGRAPVARNAAGTRAPGRTSQRMSEPLNPHDS